MRRWYEWPRVDGTPFVGYVVVDQESELADLQAHPVNEGSFAYAKDTGQFFIYNGTTWAKGFKAK